MAAGLGLSNGPRAGVGTRETGDSAPRSTTLHRLDWFFTRRSLRQRGSFHPLPHLTVLSLSLSFFRKCFRFLLTVQSRVLQISLFSCSRTTPPRNSPSFTSSSSSQNETEEKAETAGGFPTGRAKGRQRD